MAAGFPCPNPICTHVFPSETVKTAGELKCPRCGNLFRFGPKPAASSFQGPASGDTATKRSPAPPPPPKPPTPASSAPNPTAKSAPPRQTREAQVIPTATPVGGTIPEVSEPSAAFSFENADESPRIRKKKRPVKRRGVLFGIVLFTILATFVGGMVYLYVMIVPQLVDQNNRKNQVQANFSFTTTWSWKNDEKLRRSLNASIALTRSRPSRAHVALAYEDYKNRLPSDDELLDEAIKRLKANFPRLEYIDPMRTGKGKSGELDEEPAWKIEFRGTATDEVPMVGECIYMTRRGYGYWFITWGPVADEEDLPEVWEKLRSNFKFANEREGWQPSPRPSTSVIFEELNTKIDYVHDVWTPADNPRDYDAATELALRGFEIGSDKGRTRPDAYAGKAATIQVLALPKAADLPAAVMAAEEAIKKQLEKLVQTSKLERFVDPSGKGLAAPDVGAFKGQTNEYSLQFTADSTRFGLIAVVNRPQGVLVIYCECPQEKRGYWLGEFKALLETVRPAK
ncbi:MAG: hypothetical protein EBV06_07575 [Planctomycetia bacterium]|nr:hypothetical protein [Planctomycetia bacterium]